METLSSSSWWKLYLLLLDGNFILFFVVETLSSSSWWKLYLLLRGGNFIFSVLISSSSWWKLYLLGVESLIFSVMVKPNSDPVGCLSRYSRSDRVQIHIN